MMKASLLYHCTDQTGEAATWLPEDGILLWVDIDRGILHQYSPADRTVEDHTFPDMVSAIIPWKGHEQEVILAMKNRFIAYDFKQKTFRTVLELPCLHPQLRTNDCKASPEGRIWCGVMHMSKHQETGSLYCIGNDQKIVPVLSKQNIPNGIVWNPIGDRMYYADSGRGCIEEYAYDCYTGNISFLRTAIEVPEKYGVPDGMTIDANGFLWAAHWGGAGVYVWDPFTGQLVDKVEVPVPNVASCTFGGKEGKQLFITTACAGLSAEERKIFPLSGSLFVVELPEVIPGKNHYPFINYNEE